MDNLTPKTSFTEFCKSIGLKKPPKFMADIANKLSEESKHARIAVGFSRGANWIAYMEGILQTAKQLMKGKKCVLATKFPDRYIKDFKGLTKISIELKKIGENLYEIKMI